MSSYMKYLFVCILWFVLLYVKTTISSIPETQTSQYTSLTQRAQVLAQECLDSKTVCSFLPFQQGWANWVWLHTIQYIGQDVYAQYYAELYDHLQDVTMLDTYRQYPYIFGQYMLPDTSQDNRQSRQQTMDLGYKWIQALCDAEIVENIAALSDEEFSTMYYSDDRPAPCHSYLLPQSLWFTSFYYAKDLEQAIKYYRIAALSPWAPDMLFDMPAILVWRYDDDRKGMMMWQNRFFSAQEQLNPELSNEDLFFILSTMQHAMRKAVHHGFLSIIEQVARESNCGTSMQCVKNNIIPALVDYTSQCDSEDKTEQTLCALMTYAQGQWRRTKKWELIYPLEPDTMTYDRKHDVEKRDLVSK